MFIRRSLLVVLVAGLLVGLFLPLAVLEPIAHAQPADQLRLYVA